jgi:hypothetical protein
MFPISKRRPRRDIPSGAIFMIQKLLFFCYKIVSKYGLQWSDSGELMKVKNAGSLENRGFRVEMLYLSGHKKNAAGGS